ncbi:MAG: PGPGW domain-containing protein [Thermoanaerobaculia bacterium]
MSKRRATPRGLARRRSRLVRIALLTLGWALLTVGIIGGLLPVLQGWPFGVAGAAILYVESRWVQRKVRRFRQHNPRFERAWLKARAWMRGRRRVRKTRDTNAAP